MQYIEMPDVKWPYIISKDIVQLVLNTLPKKHLPALYEEIKAAFVKEYPELDWYLLYNKFPILLALELKIVEYFPDWKFKDGFFDINDQLNIKQKNMTQKFAPFIAYADEEKPTAPAPEPQKDQSTPTESKPEVPMPENNTVKEKFKRTGRKAAGIVKQAAVRGTIGEVNRQAIRKLEEKLGDKYPEMLKTDVGRKAIEALVPLVVMTICEMDSGNKIPQKAYIEAAAEHALSDASSKAISDAVGLLLEQAGPVMEAYMQGGKMLAEDLEVADPLADFMTQKERVYDAVEVA